MFFTTVKTFLREKGFNIVKIDMEASHGEDFLLLMNHNAPKFKRNFLKIRWKENNSEGKVN